MVSVGNAWCMNLSRTFSGGADIGYVEPLLHLYEYEFTLGWQW